MAQKALDILKEIKQGKTHRLYILSGVNGTYLKNNIVDNLKELLIDKKTEAFDFITFYGKSLSSNEILNSVNTPPFGKAKLIVVKNIEQMKKSEIKKVLSWKIPESSILIILSNSELKIAPKEEDSAIVNSYSITQTMLKSWIKKKAREDGKKISDEAVSELILRLDGDLFLIASEVKKLALFAGNDKEITKEDVAKVVEFIPEIRIFDLVDAIVSRKKTTALKMLKTFLDIQDSSPEQLLSLLLKTFMQMALIKELLTKNVKKTDIASKGKIYPPFLVNKLLPLAQKMHYNDIINEFKLLSKIDVQSKKGEINLPLHLRLFIEKN